MKTLLCIQYLRAMAALAVVVSHILPAALIGQAGVDVFFVVSGFITWTVTDKPISLGLFYWHRFARVVPLYWTATAAMAVHQHASLASVVRSGLFIPYRGEANRIWPVLVQGWTLNYEMAFYLLIGVAMILPRRLGGVLVASAIAAASVVHFLFHSTDAAFLTYTNPIVLEFAAGIAIAEMRSHGVLLSLLMSVVALVAGCLWFGLTAPSSLPEDSRVLLWGVPGALIVLSAVSFEARTAVARFRIALALGNASFSIYLFHPFILRTCLHLLGDCNTLVSTFGALSAVAVFGLLIRRFVEKPLTGAVQRFPGWYLRRRGGWSRVPAASKA